MKILLFATLLLAALTPAAARAQDILADTSTVRGAIRQNRICPGGRVMVVAGGERVKGRCDGVMDERLLVWVDGASRRVPLAAVDSMWMRSGFGRAPRTGALMGGIAGGLWGAFAFSSYCAGGHGCDIAVPVATLGTAALGALGGALAGGIVGGSLPRWVRLHPE